MVRAMLAFGKVAQLYCLVEYTEMLAKVGWNAFISRVPGRIRRFIALSPLFLFKFVCS